MYYHYYYYSIVACLLFQMFYMRPGVEAGHVMSCHVVSCRYPRKDKQVCCIFQTRQCCYLVYFNIEIEICHILQAMLCCSPMKLITIMLPLFAFSALSLSLLLLSILSSLYYQ